MDEHTLNQETARYVERPWGRYSKLFQEPGTWVKRLEVKPGARLSLQKHSHRSETWVVVMGEGLAVVNDTQIPVKSGTIVQIPLGAVHRIGNTGKENLIFIEVALGKYLSENDIVRFQDDYNR